MNKLSVGDTVRFLNSVGGGIVKGFQNKKVVIVEDEHGFDVPVLVSECVVVKSAMDSLLTTSDGAISPNSSTSLGNRVIPPSPKKEPAYEPPEETKEGEKITACLTWLPTDRKNLSSTSFECYFVNDSNYYLYLTLSGHDNGDAYLHYDGLVEPNTKIFVEETKREELNELEHLSVQFIAFKRNKRFSLTNPYSVELSIDPVKFYKLHSFRENDYFEEDALTYYILRNGVPNNWPIISARELEEALRGKKRMDERSKTKLTPKAETNPLTEIDLHADALLDTTAGMSNADILNYQIDKFNEVMKENIRNKNHRIVFIHGKGDGILRNALLSELKKRYPKCSYQDASFREYGYGATLITIK